jgi:hypothetical protein
MPCPLKKKPLTMKNENMRKDFMDKRERQKIEKVSHN